MQEMIFSSAWTLEVWQLL